MLSNLRSQLSEAISAAAAQMVFVVIALLLGLVGFVFVMVGLAVWLQAQMQAWQAFGLVGVVLLLAGALIVMAFRLRKASDGPQQSGGDQAPPGQDRIETYMAIGEDIGQVMRQRPRESIAAGFVIGLALGFSPELRRGLAGLASAFDPGPADTRPKDEDSS